METPDQRHGIECMAGWRTLYQPIIEDCIAAGIDIYQVKEKFAGLRIEVGPDAHLRIMHAIRYARIRSIRMCEVCGERGEPRGA